MEGKKIEYKGQEALKEIERLTSMAGEVQLNILEEISSRNNRETKYLKKYMKGSLSVSDFKHRVPVIKYKGIQPYIQRIANGEDASLITGHPITEMLCSSGTSGGEPIMVPTIAEDLDRRTFLYNLIMPIINQYVPDMNKGKAMLLYFVRAERSTPCGLPVRTVLTSYYKSSHFKTQCQVDPFSMYTSPDQIILCNDIEQSMYCQLLSGLVHRHQVLRLGAVFSSTFLRAISFLERNWDRFCNDIRYGKLDPHITDPECRKSMAKILSSPDPDQADDITRICSHESWKGILCQLWPKAKYIEACITGSMAQYIPSLQYYSDGKLPLVGTRYASSECFFGVNLKPFCDPAVVAFTLMPNMGYFEFIPMKGGESGTRAVMDLAGDDEDVSGDNLVDLVHVKLGCYYELVITTFAGLNRYRIGDVLQVTGFHNQAPEFKFICRRNVVLSIDADKTNEEDLHKSVAKAAAKFLEPLNALLLDYTSYADASSVPAGHYILYWEINLHHGSLTSPTAEYSSSLNTAVEECCIAVEEELDYVYRHCRSHDKTVGPLEIRIVESGTFKTLMDFFISKGGSINQYKTPRCIKSNKALELLDSKVKNCIFSPRDPHWTP